MKIRISRLIPMRKAFDFNRAVLLGSSSLKSDLLKELTQTAMKRHYMVLAYSDEGTVANQDITVSWFNEPSPQEKAMLSVPLLILYDSTVKGNQLKKLKALAEEYDAQMIYVGSSLETEPPADPWLAHALVIEFKKNQTEVLQDEEKIKFKTLNFSKRGMRYLAYAIILLAVGFAIGGMNESHNVSLIGKGSYQLTSDNIVKSGLLYNTPDGTAIGIMESIPSEVSSSTISKTIAKLSSTQTTVGILSLNASYYKTNQGLRAIVDFGLTAQKDVNLAKASKSLKQTAESTYTNRQLSYVAINTSTYNTVSAKSAAILQAKEALNKGNLSGLAKNSNMSAAEHISTTAAQFTQLPLYTESSIMKKIKAAKVGDIIETSVGNFELLLKIEGENTGSLKDKAYQSYLTELASIQVGNELAKKIDNNQSIDSASRLTIENEVKQSLLQYGMKA